MRHLRPSAGVRASADTLVGFYDGNRTRILIAAVVVRPECPQPHVVRGGAQDHPGGCGARRLGRGGDRLQRSPRRAVPPAHHGGRSPRVLDASSRNHALTSGLNDFGWALVVLSSFPRAMLIMSGAFGLWRAGLISNPLFAAASRPSCSAAGRHHVDERWILGTGRRLFAVCLADHRPGVGLGREPGPFEPESRDSCRVVMHEHAELRDAIGGSQTPRRLARSKRRSPWRSPIKVVSQVHRDTHDHRQRHPAICGLLSRRPWRDGAARGRADDAAAWQHLADHQRRRWSD